MNGYSVGAAERAALLLVPLSHRQYEAGDEKKVELRLGQPTAPAARVQCEPRTFTPGSMEAVIIGFRSPPRSVAPPRLPANETADP